jgi:hypothetical protein
MNQIGEMMKNQRLKVLNNSTDAPPNVGTSYFAHVIGFPLIVERRVFFDKSILSKAEGLSIYAFWVRTVHTLKGLSYTYASKYLTDIAKVAAK